MTLARLLAAVLFLAASLPLAAQLPELTLFPSNSEVEEGNAVEIDVVVTTPADQPARFRVNTIDGTAVAGEDYVAVVNRSYETSTYTKIRVSILDDGYAELDETFYVEISDVENAKAVNTRVAVTIRPNGIYEAPKISSVTAIEGDDRKTVNVYLTIPYTVRVSFSLRLYSKPITARSRIDFEPVNMDVTFRPNQDTVTVPITIYGDDHTEADETFSLHLEGTSSSAIVTIKDDDAPSTLPLVTIEDASVFEGAENPVARFRVTLSEPPLHGARVTYTTEEASAAADEDFEQTTGTLVFEPGQVLNWIEIPILPDDRRESSEWFYVDLSIPAGVSLKDTEAAAAIRDDDDPRYRYVWVHDAIAVERTGSPSYAVFRLELSSPSSEPVQIRYAIADVLEGPSRATMNRDFEGGVVHTLTFAPGETLKEVTVPIAGDAEPEPDEYFGLFLNPVTVGLELPFPGKGTIVDDDRAWAWPQLRIDDLRAVEMDALYEVPFTLTLARPAETAAKVTIETKAAGANAIEDFVPQRTEIVFAPGETSKTVFLRLAGDDAEEPLERFTIELTGADGLAIVRDSATVTILDDDAGPSRRRATRH